MKRELAMIVAALGISTGVANAGTITLSGFFNDFSNPALVASDLSGALFGNDNEIANNVALYSLSVPVAGSVSFDSNGFFAGGAEPYFTLFQGADDSATFVVSNFSEPDIDFFFSLSLAAGDYRLALGVWENMSFAENLGAGSLADGFIGLGDPGKLAADPGSPNYAYYELDVTTPDQPDQPGPSVPEPATILLLGAGLAGLAARRKNVRK